MLIPVASSSDSWFRQESRWREREIEREKGKKRTVDGSGVFQEDILSVPGPTQKPSLDPVRAMDEQAGPGVFFNSGGGGGSPGGANIKAPQSGDVGGGEAARAQYNIPGILHFLQHEWARFEVDRAHWEVERAERQVSGTPPPPSVTQVSIVVFEGPGHGVRADVLRNV